MHRLRHLSTRPEILVDQDGVYLADASDNVLGLGTLQSEMRVVYALRTNVTGGNPSQRYRPPIAPGELVTIAMNFDEVIPPGVAIASGTLEVFLNVSGGWPNNPSNDFNIYFPDGSANGSNVANPVQVDDRTLYTRINALDTANATDFLFLWEATDTNGNVYPRTALLLCTNTS